MSGSFLVVSVDFYNVRHILLQPEVTVRVPSQLCVSSSAVYDSVVGPEYVLVTQPVAPHEGVLLL